MKMETMISEQSHSRHLCQNITLWKDILCLAKFRHSSSVYDIDMESGDLGGKTWKMEGKMRETEVKKCVLIVNI